MLSEKINVQHIDILNADDDELQRISVDGVLSLNMEEMRQLGIILSKSAGIQPMLNWKLLLKRGRNTASIKHSGALLNILNMKTAQQRLKP